MNAMNIDKLKAAIGRTPGARFYDRFDGRIGVVLRGEEALIPFGAALAKEDAMDLIGDEPLIDSLGKEVLVVWNIDLFDGYSPDCDDEEE